MTVEAPVAVRVPLIEGYRSSAHIDSPVGGVTAGSVYDFVTRQFTAKAGHRYFVSYSASALFVLASGQAITYSLRCVDTASLAEAKFKAHRGADPNVVMAVPLSLTGVWLAPSNGAFNAVVAVEPTAVWHDWLVPTVHSALTIVDLGARGTG